MPYDIAKGLMARSQLQSYATPVTDVGLVTGIPSNDKVTVNCSGNDEVVKVSSGLTITMGDLVLIIRSSVGRGYITAILPTPADTNATTPATMPANDSIGVEYINAQYSGTWSSNGWSSYMDVTQALLLTGAWFYGTLPMDCLFDRVITGFRIMLNRATSGVDGPLTLHLYLHTLVDRDEFANVTTTLGPTDVLIDMEESGWYDLPISWGQLIVNLGGGIAITGDPYVVLKGIDTVPDSGALQFDWSI